VTWVPALLSDSHPPMFDALEAGDVAFFDASHVPMPGTDVDLIVNGILPRLRPGVLVHFHDIFLPDAYPSEWAWRAYNEQNAIAPLLTAGGYDVLFSSRYALTRMAPDRESSLWLRSVPKNSMSYPPSP